MRQPLCNYSGQKFMPMSVGPDPSSIGGGREPVLTQARVDRFLFSPQRLDVGAISGKAGRHLRTLGNGAVAWYHAEQFLKRRTPR
jgi:hypothetical protein